MFDHLPEIFQKTPFMMSRKVEYRNAGLPMVSGVERIKSVFAEKGNSGTTFRETFLLPQIVFISSIKPISSRFSLNDHCKFNHRSVIKE